MNKLKIRFNLLKLALRLTNYISTVISAVFLVYNVEPSGFLQIKTIPTIFLGMGCYLWLEELTDRYLERLEKKWF
jgi:hypothetical protein